MRALVVRKCALDEWQEASTSGKLLGRGLDLSDLLRPGIFLTALRQPSARKLQLLSSWEKDKLTPKFE